PGNDLKVTKVDFLKSQNSVQHHTDAYDTTSLVVRRGQAFLLQLSLSRELRAADKLALHFSVGKHCAKRESPGHRSVPAKPCNVLGLFPGERPMKPMGTLMSLNPRSTKDLSGWHTTITKSSGTECLLSVTSAADATVGKYSLAVKTGSNIYKPENNTVYVLFNPWCEADAVFLTNEAERKEYVLNDTGYIYVGSAYSIHGRPWNFGQFEEFILEACMYLLDKSRLKMSSRRDPVVVSRAMSALVNANDDNGVMLGNWSGNYDSGTSPMAWIGSVAILQQYYKTKKPVSFGQCWVFSGVLTTVMRCLGIPARSVSNFNSAHDTDENLRVDVYLNEKGEKLKGMSVDSIWNFHVWNDVWMKRKDLPAGFDGWQAIDSTPQEQSQGIFQCGPCPLKAVRDGEVYLPYDSKFVYAEVNADQVYWCVKEENGKTKYIKLSVETQSIGTNISTKAVGQNRREDITRQYKFPEGSSEERSSMQRAISFLQPSRIVPRARFASAAVSMAEGLESVDGEAVVQKQAVRKTGVQLEITNEKPLCPGEPIEVAITVKSTAAGSWTVDLAGSCQLQSYTGKVEANLGYIKETVTLEGKSEVHVPLKIAPDAYMKALAAVEDEEHIHVTAIAEIQGTPEKLTKEVALSFEYPPIQVQMPETAKLNKDFSCAFIFKNKLNVPLDNCKLMVEGLGIFKMTTFEEGDVQPGRIIKSEVICTPTRAGEKKIVARLTSNQIKGISVEKAITITH
ncbi:TGM4 glutamyltransferase, partial [Chauna torquata]|nr:TGM4 glutamyltransferase [Chauna torquata]